MTHHYYQKITKILLVSITLTGSMVTQSLAAVKVGVTAGPHEMILEKVKEEGKKQGLEIESIVFNDFILPNVALNQGDLDANSYQHQPYLDNQVKSMGYKIVSLGKTVLMPMGIYSASLKTMNDLKEGAKVGIPNDPSNGARALKLLEVAGVIKLKAVEMPSVTDITENPKKISIIELEAPQVLRSLDDLDCVITNTDWVALAKMDPKSALIQEDKNSPYANVIAVTKCRQNEADLKKLLEIYHSKPIKDYIESEFKGAVIPAF